MPRSHDDKRRMELAEALIREFGPRVRYVDIRARMVAIGVTPLSQTSFCEKRDSIYPDWRETRRGQKQERIIGNKMGPIGAH